MNEYEIRNPIRRPRVPIADFSVGGTEFLRGFAQKSRGVKLEEGQVRWFGFAIEESRAREILARLRYRLPERAFAQGETHG